MNHRIKRVLLGAATVAMASVAYGESRPHAAMDSTAAAQSGTGQHEVSVQDLQQQEQRLRGAVVKLQQQVQSATAADVAATSQLQSSQAQALSLQQHILTVQQRTTVAAPRVSIVVATGQPSSQPTVQSVSKASGSSTDGGDGEGGGGDD